MRLLRRFAVIGLLVTTMDSALLVLLARRAGWPVAAADAAALMVATPLSLVLHRWVTQRADPARRWYQDIRRVIATAVGAAAIDVGVVAAANAAFGLGSIPALLVAKAVAVGTAAGVRAGAYRRVMHRSVRLDQSAPLARPAPPGRLRLSIVVPAYNEAGRIGTTIAELRRALAEIDAAGGVELIVVDDDSADGTVEAARAAGADLVLNLDRHRGKGAAVRKGVHAASGRVVAFTDADLSYSPDQLVRLLEEAERGWDVVVGSRRHTDTKTLVRALRLREIGGRAINVLTTFVLLGQYRDTQCGLKAFRSDAADVLFRHSLVDGFAFDVELFHLVERYRLTLTEVPVSVTNSPRSSVRVARDAARMLADLWRIRRWARHGRYEPAPGEVEGLGTRPDFDRRD